MTDESNGESTFEFVEKRVDDISISGETTKTGLITLLYLNDVNIYIPLKTCVSYCYQLISYF